MKRLAATVVAVCVLLAACDRQPERWPADEPARRLIALSPHLTELVYTAGAGDRLVGAVEYSDYPAEALDVPRIGDAFRLDYEAIAAVNPDLILAWGSGTPVDVQDRLRNIGYHVVPLDATGLDGIAAQVERIGALTGTERVAEAAAAAYRARLAELRERYREVPVVDVFYQISAQPLFTITGRHVISEAIDTCGGHNVFADVAGLSPAVSLEAVLVAEPDVIVAGHDTLPSGRFEELAARWSGWTSIPAVRDGHLYVLDSDRMHRPTTRILDAVETLCAHLDDVRRSTGGASRAAHPPPPDDSAPVR